MTDIPGNVSTGERITLNGTVSSHLDFDGDQDWFAFQVAQDTLVSVSLTGAGFGPVSDTYLRIFDGNGRLLDENDDISDTNLNSELRFTAEADTPYFISAAAYDGGSASYTGDYTLSVSETAPPSPTDSIRWGLRRDTNDITYYFAPDGVTQIDADGFTSDGFNAYERARFEAAFTAISDVADVTFTETTSISDADFVLILDDDEIRTLPFNQQFAGFFTVTSSRQAVGVFNADNPSWDRSAGGGLEMGGDGYQTIVHEILHGMGLAHPHDDGGSSDILNGVSNPFNDYGDFDLNQGVFTAMSYNTGYRTGNNLSPFGTAYGYDAGPMAIDIAVLQDLYGANTTTASGDTTYRLPSDNGVGTAWQSIWDTGGVDTIVFDGDRDVTIDLRAATLEYEHGGGGFISNASGIRGGLTIANGVTIENAIGGTGTDTLTGNAADNALYGAGGDDAITGGDGADALYGQSGSDDLSSDRGANTFYGGSGFDEITGGRQGDVVYAGSGDDIVDANDGNDVIYGGRGNDTLDGGNGDDALYGGMGQDRLTGGQGADHFVFDFVTDSRVGADNRDTITDLEAVDRIDLSTMDTRADISGDQAFAYVGTGAFSGDQAEVRIQSTADGAALIAVDKNGDGVADMEILVMNAASLDGDTFIL